jgi:hypothetical protein
MEKKNPHHTMIKSFKDAQKEEPVDVTPRKELTENEALEAEEIREKAKR